MSRWKEPTSIDLEKWEEYKASLPDSVKELAEKFDPWSNYQVKATGHYVRFGGMTEGNHAFFVAETRFNDIPEDAMILATPDVVEIIDEQPEERPEREWSEAEIYAFIEKMNKDGVPAMELRPLQVLSDLTPPTKH